MSKEIPESEKGAFGPLDTLNRYTYDVSKKLAIGSGIAGVLLPFTAPVAIPLAIGAGSWAVGDKLQLEISKWTRKQLKKMKPGQSYKVAA